MNQHQRICPYRELVDPFALQNFKGYQDLVKTNHVNTTTISEDFDIQESYNATTTNSFAPSLGSSSNTFTISFGDLTSPTTINESQLYGAYKLENNHDAIKSTEEIINLNELIGSLQLPKRVSSTRRNHRQAQEHILAERKRRQKLTRRFISLSALLPEIKKVLIFNMSSNFLLIQI